MFDAYQEDAEAAQVALPWLDPHEDVRRQLRDMLYDIEAKTVTTDCIFGPFTPPPPMNSLAWWAWVMNCNRCMQPSTWATGCAVPIDERASQHDA